MVNKTVAARTRKPTSRNRLTVISLSSTFEEFHTGYDAMSIEQRNFEKREFTRLTRISCATIHAVKAKNETYRIGQIVPSSNTTMETEIPSMLHAREASEPERFTFHSSRMRMKKVTKEELEAMDADSGRCAAELVDARVDVLGYACLVAIMSMGKGYHRDSEARLHEISVKEGYPTPVVTSAGALIAGLKALN